VNISIFVIHFAGQFVFWEQFNYLTAFTDEISESNLSHARCLPLFGSALGLST
jgi:hypothetical protein